MTYIKHSTVKYNLSTYVGSQKTRDLSFLPKSCPEVQQGSYLAIKEESSLSKELI